MLHKHDVLSHLVDDSGSSDLDGDARPIEKRCLMYLGNRGASQRLFLNGGKHGVPRFAVGALDNFDDFSKGNRCNICAKFLESLAVVFGQKVASVGSNLTHFDIGRPQILKNGDGLFWADAMADIVLLENRENLPHALARGLVLDSEFGDAHEFLECCHTASSLCLEVRERKKPAKPMRLTVRSCRQYPRTCAR